MKYFFYSKFVACALFFGCTVFAMETTCSDDYDKRYYHADALSLSTIGFALLDTIDGDQEKNPVTFKKAWDMIHVAAEKGDAKALFATGDVVKAALCNCKDAQLRLAQHFIKTSLEDPYNPDYSAAFEAYTWLKRAEKNYEKPSVYFDYSKRTYVGECRLNSQDKESYAYALCRLGQLFTAGLLPQLGPVDQALSYFEKAEKIGSDRAINELFHFYSCAGDNEKALNYKLRLSLVNHAHKGIIAEKKGDMKIAQAAYETVLEIAPAVLANTKLNRYVQLVDRSASFLKENMLAILEPEAQQGDPVAQYMLGSLYARDKKGERDIDKAVKCFNDVLMSSYASQATKVAACRKLVNLMAEQGFTEFKTTECFSTIYEIVKYLVPQKDDIKSLCLLLVNVEKKILMEHSEDSGLIAQFKKSGCYDVMLAQAQQGDQSAKKTLILLHQLRSQMEYPLLGTQHEEFETLRDLVENVSATNSEDKEILSTAYAKLADYHSTEGNYEQEMINLKKALQYTPDEEGLKFGLAQCYLTTVIPSVTPKKAIEEGLRLLRGLAEKGSMRAARQLSSFYSPDADYVLGCGGTIKRNRQLSIQYARMVATIKHDYNQIARGLNEVFMLEEDDENKVCETERLYSQLCGDSTSQEITHLIELIKMNLRKCVKNTKLKNKLEKKITSRIEKLQEISKVDYWPTALDTAILYSDMAQVEFCFGNVAKFEEYFANCVRALLKAIGAGMVQNGQFVLSKCKNDSLGIIRNVSRPLDSIADENPIKVRLSKLLVLIKNKFASVGIQIS